MEKSNQTLNIPVSDAAAQMGVSAQFVRIGLQRGLLPFGTAVRISGKKYTYYINPKQFRAYLSGALIEREGEVEA